MSVKCAKCLRPIEWVRRDGRWIPVNIAATVAEGVHACYRDHYEGLVQR